MAELLIGCGNHREKLLRQEGHEPVWHDLVTLDIDPNCGADVEWNLERLPLPFPDEHFDEIHAYHTLEHVGAQGDFRFFFAQFADFWRLLKPGGFFFGIQPAPGSPWEWGDPGHTRIIRPEALTYLDQSEYVKQVGKTALADYRHVYRADFEAVMGHVEGDQFYYAIRAVKPSRISL